MLPKSTFKVVMLGEGIPFQSSSLPHPLLGRVGKTSLTTKYCLGQFNENEESTINASYLQKEIELGGQKKTLAIWVYHCCA